MIQAFASRREALKNGYTEFSTREDKNSYYVQ